MTPEGATAIAAPATSGRPVWPASLRHALLAAACALSAAAAALAGTPANSVDAASAAHAVTAAPRAETTAPAVPPNPANPANPTAPTAPTDTADTALSPRDAAVRQVVLGIISFTRWPSPPARLHLCVTGRPDYAQGLADAQQAGSTPLDVQRVRFDDAALGASCDVVYLGGLSDTERQRVAATVAGRPVLTITEHDPSCTTGSMFCLNVDGERVTFEINLDAVARSGVRVHPNVLNLARRPVTP
jgi:hypothetical protein